MKIQFFAYIDDVQQEPGKRARTQFLRYQDILKLRFIFIEPAKQALNRFPSPKILTVL